MGLLVAIITDIVTIFIPHPIGRLIGGATGGFLAYYILENSLNFWVKV